MYYLLVQAGMIKKNDTKADAINKIKQASKSAKMKNTLLQKRVHNISERTK